MSAKACFPPEGPTKSQRLWSSSQTLWAFGRQEIKLSHVPRQEIWCEIPTSISEDSKENKKWTRIFAQQWEETHLSLPGIGWGWKFLVNTAISYQTLTSKIAHLWSLRKPLPDTVEASRTSLQRNFLSMRPQVSSQINANEQWWSVRQSPVLGNSHYRAPRLQPNSQRGSRIKDLSVIRRS